MVGIFIEDTRQQSKVQHILKDILVIVLFATLSNADDWVEMALLAESCKEYLKKYIKLENGVPSHDTIHSVIWLVSPEILRQLQVTWRDILNQNKGEAIKKIICMDSENKKEGEKASNVVAALSKEGGFCFGQKAVEKKSNEITAILELLEKIQIKGQVVIIDTMGTHTEIVEKIKAKHADYLLEAVFTSV